MSENERITREFMRGYQDGTTIAKGVAESLLAQANSEKATLMRRVDELCEANEKLRELVASYDSAYVKPVRCKDCEYYSDHEWVLITDVSDVCHFWHGEPTKVAPDGYCAWGKRREDNQDDIRDTIRELLSKIGPSNEARECLDEQLRNRLTDYGAIGN